MHEDRELARREPVGERAAGDGRQAAGGGAGEADGGEVRRAAALRRELQAKVAGRECDAARRRAHHHMDEVEQRQRQVVRMRNHGEGQGDQAAEVGGQRHGEDRLVGQAIGNPAPEIHGQRVRDLARDPQRGYRAHAVAELLQ